jgi:hypothetical protein
VSAYDGQSDEELMQLAKTAMLAAAAEPVGTVERAMKFAAHESIMNELARRLQRHALRALNEKLGLPDFDL